MYINSNKRQFFFEPKESRIFCKSEPRDSYKNNSYKKNCVYEI